MKDLASLIAVLAGLTGGVLAQINRGNAPGAMELLRENQDAMFALRSYQAVCYKDGQGDGQRVSRLRAEKPNLMRYDSWSDKESPDRSFVEPKERGWYTISCDGKQRIIRGESMYSINNNAGPDYQSTLLEPWDGFYLKQNSIYGMLQTVKGDGQLAEANYLGRKVEDSVSCDVILVHFKTPYGSNSFEYWNTYAIGSADHLVRSLSSKIKLNGHMNAPRLYLIRHIAANYPLNQTVFNYEIPFGCRPFTSPSSSKPLLPNGGLAPEFAAQTVDGKMVRLSDLRGKVVVIDFWSSWCGPCNQSMPHTDEVVAKLSKEGLPVVALAVDDAEGRSAFAVWVKKKGPSYPNILFVYSAASAKVSAKAYSVTGIPTQYILDKDGVIRASFVGYGGPTDDLEKAIRGACAK